MKSLKKILVSMFLFSLLSSAICTEYHYPSRKDHHAVVFNGSVLIIGGNAGMTKGKYRVLNDIWMSDNLKQWVLWKKDFLVPSRLDFSVTVFNGKLWAIGGYGQDTGRFYADVWNSSDGKKWRQVILEAPFKGRSNATVFAFDGKLWLIGGTVSMEGKYVSDVWNSENGIEWNKVADSLHFFSDYECKVAQLNGKIFIFSYGEGVYSSTDCVNWEKIKINDEKINGKYFYSVEVFNNSLYILCGQNRQPYYAFNEFLNDVWKSSNGEEWLHVSPYPEKAVSTGTGNTPFSIAPGRCGQASFVFNGKMFITGGVDEESNFLNDIWYSDDGVKWFVFR